MIGDGTEYCTLLRAWDRGYINGTTGLGLDFESRLPRVCRLRVGDARLGVVHSRRPWKEQPPLVHG